MAAHSTRHAVRRCVFVIAGYWQDRSRPTGSWNLYRDLCQYRSTDVEIQLLNWSDNVREWATAVWQVAQEAGEQPRVSVFGYSWGGQTAINFARELGNRGINVDCMILCDPVRRLPLPLWLAKRAAAFLPWLSLRVTGNVKRCTAFCQTMDYPRAHAVVDAEGNRVAMHELKMVHAYMDDSREYHQECHRCVAA